jgi:DNA (cytosine-5)-methyltransferase 1
MHAADVHFAFRYPYSSSAEVLRRVRQIPTLSLFSGAGGLDIGFHSAGFKILACVEISRHYANTLSVNSGKDRFFSESPQIFCQDIRDFDPTPFVGMGIECVIGGPPCQTFSAAGRRSGGVLGTDDERGRLFSTYCKILSVLKPRAFVFENVYGLPGANGGGPWREIVSAFSAIGYTLRAEVIDTADYGVPQHRERLIMVGFRSGEFLFPMPTHGPDSASRQPFVSVSDAISDLQVADEPYHQDFGGMYGHLLPLVPEGLNYSFFTAEMGYPEPIFAWRSKFHDLLYKVDPSTPCRTIKAQPGKFTGPFHWKNRHFTVNELKRLQSFPDDYEIVGSYSRVVEQIGNSVPPKAANTIAVAVREQLFDAVGELTVATRPPGFTSSFRVRQRERNSHFRNVAAIEISRRFSRDVATMVHAKESETYFATYDGFFGKEKLLARPRLKDPTTQAYRVKVEDTGHQVGIAIRSLNRVPATQDLQIRVSISGLKKYLGRIDSVSAAGKLTHLSELFHMWELVGDTLVTKSRFLSLIDIYGHYANRGDTVKILTEFDFDIGTPVATALEYFGRSENCGAFISKRELATTLQIGLSDLNRVISELRSMRFDIRTSLTHPTIDTDAVICTYPFPLLSERAHLERRLRPDLNRDESYVA